MNVGQIRKMILSQGTLFTLVCFLSGTLFCKSGFAAQSVLYAVADAYVDAQSPDSNFGSVDFLKVGGPMQVWHSYVRFDLAGIDPGLPVVSATLQLTEFEINGYDPQAYATHFVTSSWAENAITWNTQPSTGNPCSFTTVPFLMASSTPHVWTADITEYVKAWLGQRPQCQQQPNNGVAVMRPPAGPSQGFIRFRSREYINQADRPTLIIVQ